MYARHSIHYTRLPDLFLAFDIYDKKKGKFVSRKTRDKLLEGTGISTVPLLHVGKCSREDYERLLKSNGSFHDGVVEVNVSPSLPRCLLTVALFIGSVCAY